MAKKKQQSKTRRKERIQWVEKTALVADIVPAPKNYKIKTELGLQRFRESLNTFGNARSVVCNWAGKYGDLRKLMCIDGHSLIDDAKERGIKTISVKVPNVVLSLAMVKEMNAVFDFSRAGDTDTEGIEKDYGNTESFFKKYGMHTPLSVLNNLGKAAPLPDLPTNSTKAVDEVVVEDEKLVQLFFTAKQEEQFRKMEDKLKVKFKSASTTETVFKAFKKLTK